MTAAAIFRMLTAAFFLIPVVSSAQSAPARLPQAAMDQYFARLAPFGASGAIVIAQRGRIVYRTGFGMADRAKRIPMTPAAGVDIASMTKTLTAVAILQLEERDLLHRTDSISAHLDSVPDDKRSITIQQLLMHRSGLPQYFMEGNDFVRINRRDALHGILAAKLDFPPGTDESYSDAGYTLLAMIAERVTGDSIETLLDREQFRRAGISRTHSYGTSSLNAMINVAHGYLGHEDRGTPVGYVSTPDYWILKGAGGVVSTADDIAAWELALERGSLLGAESRAALAGTVDSVGIAGDRIVMPSGRTAWVRTGAQDFGFASAVLRYVSDSTIAVITINRQPEAMDVSNIRDRLLYDMDAFIFGKAPPMPPSVIARSVPESIEGMYQLGDSSTLRIEVDGDRIVAYPDGPLAVELLTQSIASHSRASRLELTKRAVEMIRHFCTGDSVTFRSAFVRESPRLESYVRSTACADTASRLRAVGTLPRWWARPPSESLATILEVSGTGKKQFRLEWAGDRISAVGGGAVMAPATSFVAAGNGEYIGYHLGIRSPVRMIVVNNALEFRGDGVTYRAVRVGDGATPD